MADLVICRRCKYNTNDCEYSSVIFFVFLKKRQSKLEGQKMQTSVVIFVIVAQMLIITLIKLMFFKDITIGFTNKISDSIISATANKK